jgi:hypothetical protein
MAKTLIKIVISLLVLHAAFRVGMAYWTFYRFEDALQQSAQFADRKADKMLCDEAADAAANYGVPISPSAVTVFRGNKPPFNCDGGVVAAEPGAARQPNTQIRIEGSYVDQLQVLPGYYYPWEFKATVKAWLRL